MSLANAFTQIVNLLQDGTNMIGKGLDARRKASRLRRQRSALRRGRTGIPSNAVQLRTTARGSNRGFSNLPHHNIRIHEVFYATSGSYNPGDYKLTLKVLPFKWLSASPYNPLLDIYEKMRINTYKISVYLPTFSPVAKASSASWLARDSTAVTGNDSYLKILEQPGHKRGRGHTIHTYVWKPVEPEDYDYRECSAAFDSSDWGTILYSMIGAIPEFPEQPNALIEYTATYSFANLRAPTASSDQAQKVQDVAPHHSSGAKGYLREQVACPAHDCLPRAKTEQSSDEDDSISVVDVAGEIGLSPDEQCELHHLLSKLNLSATTVAKSSASVKSGVPSSYN